MSFRTICAVAGLAASCVLLGACATSVDQAWTAPGWYLEQPRALVMAHPAYIAGPYSYEECETDRLKAPRPDRLLCTRRPAKPSTYESPSPLT
jgi:hypothetical protein